MPKKVCRDFVIQKRNNIYQHIVVLKTNRYKRHQYQEVFVEGVRNINLALQYGWKVKHWIYSQDHPLSSWASGLLTDYPTASNYAFCEQLLSEISAKSDTSELMAIFEMKQMQVIPSENPLIVLCNCPSKKGNLGSIIRSAGAFGCDGVLVTGHAVDIYDPEVMAASMGSYFAINLQKIDTNAACLAYIDMLKKLYPDLQVVATTEDGEDIGREIDFTCPTLLLMGNEANGLSRFYWDVCDKTVKIPMTGEASSLNLACAASIFLYEAYTQRSIERSML